MLMGNGSDEWSCKIENGATLRNGSIALYANRQAIGLKYRDLQPLLAGEKLLMPPTGDRRLEVDGGGVLPFDPEITFLRAGDCRRSREKRAMQGRAFRNLDAFMAADFLQ